MTCFRSQRSVIVFKKILVPLDGSAQAEHALKPAAEIAQRSGATLALVHADTPDNFIYVEGHPVLDEQGNAIRAGDPRSHEHAYLQRLAEDLRQAHHISVIGEVLSHSGLSAAQLLATHIDATLTDDDLIVMTTHGRGGIERLWLGSVTENLIRTVNAPILLIKPDISVSPVHHPAQWKRVLLPLDGSETPERMLPLAQEMANLFDAELALMRVVTTVEQAMLAPFDYASTWRYGTIEQQQAEAETYLRKIAQTIPARTARVTTHVAIASHVANSIVDATNAVPGTLIAMNTHARSSLAQLLLGSVADKVVRAAGGPVLVQRPRDVQSQ